MEPVEIFARRGARQIFVEGVAVAKLVIRPRVFGDTARIRMEDDVVFPAAEMRFGFVRD